MSTDERIPSQLQDYFGWLDDDLGPVDPDSLLPPEEPTRYGNDRSHKRRPSHHRSALVAACVVLVVGAIVAIAAVARDRIDDMASPTPPPSIATETDGPAWYRAIRPFLPAGFEHITVHESNDQYAEFIALDPLSGKTLYLTVTRGAMTPDPDGSITLEQAETEPWTDNGADLNVSLPDGRQVGVQCGFRAAPQGSPNCPTINGQATDPEDVRELAVALATEVDISDLPAPASMLGHVPTGTIRTAVDRVIAFDGETAEVEAPHYAVSSVQLGEVDQPEFVLVRTDSGYFPPLPTDLPRRSASVDGNRLTWQVDPDGVVWFVSDHPEYPGYDVADEILDVAVGATGAVPTEAPDGFSIWTITSSGSSGFLAPSDPDAADSATEIHWSVGWNELVAPAPGDDTIELADGTIARYRSEPDDYQLATWQQKSGSWISITSLNGAIDGDELIDVASSFTSATPGEVARLQALIATNVRATFDRTRTATIDGTTIELFTLDGAPVAMCISADRCEVALGPVTGFEPDSPVVGFTFESADGSADHYALFYGSFDRLEATDGVTVNTQPGPDDTWVHAHRPANVPDGSVRVVNPSAELDGIVGFDV